MSPHDPRPVSGRTLIRPPNRERLLFVDAARGVAMLFVFLSHFAYVYFPVGRTGEILAAVGRSAEALMPAANRLLRFPLSV